MKCKGIVKVCEFNKDLPYWTLNTHWKREMHCKCKICESKRTKDNLDLCINGSCKACKEYYA